MGYTLTWRNVAAWRLARHGLAARQPAERSLEVVGAICGLHAQLLSSAELSLWARVDGLTSDWVTRALWEDRTLVKTWAMRGTLHLLPASEYWMWQAGLSTYDHYLKPSWFKYFGVTAEQLTTMVSAIAEVLDGQILTREELAEAVASKTAMPELASKLRESWGALLKPASFQGRLCFGPGLGRSVRFTSPQWWLGGRDGSEPDAALAAISRRFLESGGPASREDYARWWAVSPARAEARIRALGDLVTQVNVEGTRQWMLAHHADEALSAEPAGTVNLLPAFDQYVIAATRHAENLMPGPFKSLIYRSQGWISPVLLVDGRMEGVWSHDRKSGVLRVSILPFGSLEDWVKTGVENEAESLARFLECVSFDLSFVDPV